MKIGIGLTGKAYNPEAYAYQEYLSKNGFSVQLADENELKKSNDVNIYFMGIRPITINSSVECEIHEYHSLSTGMFPRAKDMIKKGFNKKPLGRIFLNEVVEKKMGFKDDVPFILRDMGVDDALFQEPNARPDFDLIYCGSVIGRKGLLKEIKRLENIGFSVLIVGHAPADFLYQFGKSNKIEFTGKVARSDLPELYRNARAGINYMPDLYPLNIQTSTKTIEYLASGLTVLSSRYEWANKFFEASDPRCIYLDEIESYREIIPHGGGVDDFRWENILFKSGIIAFLNQVYYRR